MNGAAFITTNFQLDAYEIISRERHRVAYAESLPRVQQAFSSTVEASSGCIPP